ncbi:MAG: hypothetical protein Q9191_008550, partial [Dirinaria sp. TL-2023a]
VKGFIRQIKKDGTVRDESLSQILSEENKEKNFIPDSDCGMSCIDRQFLGKKVPNYIAKLTSSIKIRGVDNAVASSSKYVNLKISLPDKMSQDQHSAVAKIRRQMHIVDDLKANMLIDSDIMSLEDMEVNYPTSIMAIDSCNNIRVPMSVIAADKIHRVVRALSTIVVSANSIMMIPTRLRGKSDLPSDRELMFTPYRQTSTRFGADGDGILSHIVDANMCAMQVNNISNESVTVARNCRLGTVHEYEKEGCYAAMSEDAHLAADTADPSTIMAGGSNKRYRRAANS